MALPNYALRLKARSAVWNILWLSVTTPELNAVR